VEITGTGYRKGEYYAEAHTLLDVRKNKDVITVYTIASVGWFGFQNGIFTKISGSGANPVVILLQQNSEGDYNLLNIRNHDNGGYDESIKDLFPKELHDEVFDNNAYLPLKKQMEKQAERYLKAIGRKAKVNADYVTKKLVNIDIKAANELWTINPFVNICPHWIGTQEFIEDGIRFIYKTDHVTSSDGKDIVIFTKTKEGGTLVKENYYKIEGHEPILIKETIADKKFGNITEKDNEKALYIVKKYFEAFSKADYNEMRSISTKKHNSTVVHDGDVWGMKWARAKEIRLYSSELISNHYDRPVLVFEISVDCETVSSSAQYPCTQSFFYLVLEKGDDGIWRVNEYTTG